eukprot:CAMPEP_0183581050 /NCGR_PEP_ID=MMETSP0371-20130417/146932_1 /TAXON_ID=268820 /ORGANISM="Peridinium aciculiferum, Strain PAER-2" /LENGTH=249 /DNA_ID=CAMNT_0025791699 /DNA_START=26 /DNA_END=772 /DNA_ORIENTATION=-
MWLVGLLFAMGPLFATFCALNRNQEWTPILAPACMATHALYYLLGWIVSLSEFKKPWEVTKKYTTGPAGQQFPEEWMRAVKGGYDSDESDLDGYASGSVDDEEERERDKFAQLCDLQRPSYAENKKVIDINNAVQGTTRRALAFSALVWLCTLAATTVELVPRIAVSLLGAGGNPLEDIEILDMAWPVPNLNVADLACERDHIFASNLYQVFGLNISSGEVKVVPCGDLNQLIADVTIACPTSGACHPI